MLLKDPKLFVLAAALYLVPVATVVAVAAETGGGPWPWIVAALAATAVAVPFAGRVATRLPRPGAWRTLPALDAAAWALAVAGSPILCFLIYAFGGAELATAFFLMLLSYPLNAVQLDAALDRMAAA